MNAGEDGRIIARRLIDRMEPSLEDFYCRYNSVIYHIESACGTLLKSVRTRGIF